MKAVTVNLSSNILLTKQEIDCIKQRIDKADPGEKRRLQRRLKELQTLQLWQLSQAENYLGVQPADDLFKKINTELDAALIEHEELMRIAQDRADKVKAFAEAGDLR